MSRSNTAAALTLLIALLLAVGPGYAQRDDTALGIGAPMGAADLSRFFAIPPDGAGLPAGRGTAAQGASVYRQHCASCHGNDLRGQKSIGAPALIGGRGTLTGSRPIRTVESYWPYATTLFDYVKRAMPLTAPGSLSDNQVYAVSAFILSQGGICVPADGLDAATLPRVLMPNRDGFVADHRPELQLYHTGQPRR